MKVMIILIFIAAGLIIAYQLLKVRRNQLPKDKTYNFAGSVMNYSVLGSGKPVVLLHGSMLSNPSWRGFEKELAKWYTVYLPDLPGFGASDAVAGRLHNTDLFAESLCAFIKHAKLEKVPVIAFSLGTVVAVKSAINGCLSGELILVGVPVKVDSQILKYASYIPIFIRRLVGSTDYGRDKLLVPVLHDIIGVKDNKRDDELLKNLQVTDTRSLVDLDVYKEVEQHMSVLIPRLKNKTVFIYGSADKLIESTKNLVKNPIIINGADHNVFTSQPDKTFSAIRKILK